MEIKIFHRFLLTWVNIYFPCINAPITLKDFLRNKNKKKLRREKTSLILPFVIVQMI